ncbi:MAG TPA: phage tail tube protein [Chryseosolibacter sp.]|nr:phage tail tube protein [Chryseosolibacter sp.]
MATVAPTDGTDLPLKISDTSTAVEIVNLVSNSTSRTTDTRGTTTKQSGTHKEYVATRHDMTHEFEGLYTTTDDASKTSFDQLDTWRRAGTVIYWEKGTGVSGTRKESGRGIIVSLDDDAPDGDNVTFSGSIQNTGDPTITTYA